MSPDYEWEQYFDERQKKEIAFSRLYATHYAHGTEGHNAKLIIAKMAALLNKAEGAIDPLLEKPLTDSSQK